MTEQTQAPEVTESRKVVLTDGSIADFGSRNNILQSKDAETGTITFKVFTGEILVADLNKVEALGYAQMTDLGKTYALAAAGNKIKMAISTAKLTEAVVGEDGEITVVHTLANAIQEAIDSIEKGEFSTRSSAGESDEGLDDVVKYFAVAAGAFYDTPIKYVYANEAFAPAVKREGSFLLFNEDVDASVILEITNAWEALSTKEKNAAKRDQLYKLVEVDAIKFKLGQI